MTLTSKLRGGTACILAGFVLLSAVAGPWAVGLASASSYSKTVTGSPDHVVIDQSTISGSYTLEIRTNDYPGHSGQKLIYSETRNAANKAGTVSFGNFEAYENVTVTVRGVSSEPDMGPGSQFNKVDWSPDEIFLHTGADNGLACNLEERIATAANPAYDFMDCGYTLPGTTTVENATQLDANETKLEIYESAQTRKSAADTLHTMVSNRLQNTETVALTNHARPAYIEALNDGLKQSAANTTAVENITEYYSVMEANILTDWNEIASQAQYFEALETNQSGISDSFARVPVATDSETWGSTMTYNFSGFGSTTYTLQNGTTLDVKTFKVTITDTEFGNTYTYTVGPTTGTIEGANGQGVTGKADTHAKSGDIERFYVSPPTSNYDGTTHLDFNQTAKHLRSINEQTEATIGQMSTIVNNTYDAYQAGTINTSDLVTPATLMSNYSPSGYEYQGYAAATLANLGVEVPANYSEMGTMNVSFADNTTAQGIIMAKNNPASGQWEVGVKYNPDTIAGTEFLVGDGSIREIGQNFTITNVTTQSGTHRQNFTIEQRNYDTATAEDLEKLYQQFEQLRATINARQSALGGGGGFNLGGLSGQQKMIALAGLALIGYGYTRDN